MEMGFLAKNGLGPAGGGWLLCEKRTTAIGLGIKPDPKCTSMTLGRKNPLDGPPPTRPNH